MSRLDKMPEFTMFIEVTGKISVALIDFSKVYAKKDELDQAKKNIDDGILRGNPYSLGNLSDLKQTYKVRDKTLLNGLIVLKLLFERGLFLLNKLIEVAKKDASN